MRGKRVKDRQRRRRAVAELYAQLLDALERHFRNCDGGRPCSCAWALARLVVDRV